LVTTLNSSDCASMSPLAASLKLKTYPDLFCKGEVRDYGPKNGSWEGDGMESDPGRAVTSVKVYDSSDDDTFLAMLELILRARSLFDRLMSTYLGSDLMLVNNVVVIEAEKTSYCSDDHLTVFAWLKSSLSP
jgi:hypothetical protein